MPVSRPKKYATDRVTTIGACAWFAGLTSWYAGAHDAIDRTLDAMPLFVAVAIVAVLAGLGSLTLQPKLGKAAFGEALFLAAGFAFVGFNLATLANRYVDGSAPQLERGTVLAFKEPTKGPKTIQLALRGERISFAASNAEGCSVGDRVVVELRSGAFGAEWMRSIRCASAQ